MGDEAGSNLEEIRKLFPDNAKVDSASIEDVRSRRERYDLVLIDTEDTTWLATEDLKPWRRIVWSGSRRTLRDVKLVVDPNKPKSFAARHNRMGGATSAKSIMIWTGEGAEEITLGGEGVFPTRPSGDWINPAAPIWTGVRTGVRGQSTDKISGPVWSAPEEKSFPWPLPQEPFEIEAPSVFLHGKLTRRALTVKEKASLLDLPALWPASVIDSIWGWKGGKLLPLRVYVEVLMSMFDWFEPVNAGSEDQVGTKDGGGSTGVNDMLLRSRVAHKVGDTTMFRLSHFSWVWEPKETEKVSTATKGDEAAVDVSLWDVGGASASGARKVIQRALHRWWRRRIMREARAEVDKARESGMWEEMAGQAQDCAVRAGQSSWFEWSDGSRLIHWRWPECWRNEARLGARAYHETYPPKNLKGRLVPRESPEHTRLLAEKLEKLMRRRYIVPADPGELWCVIPYFAVPKGNEDIRVVWSDTENGVNPSIYTPSFFLPLPETLFRRVGDNSFMGDLDVGEMFHNFPLHPAEQRFAGIRIDPELQKLLNCGPMYKWTRLPFGWRPSPYFSVTMLSRGVELAVGDRTDPENPFWWTEVILNLPGMDSYDPGKPWIRRVREDGLTACDVIFFVDDGRVIGPTEELATRATRKVASGIQYRGIQDASRKRRKVSQRPGAWAGTVVFSDQGVTRKFVTQAKWDKVKGILERLESMVKSDDELPTKELMSFRGFLVHVSMTYAFMRPYLKGLHLTIDSWRDNRGTEGWPSPPEEDDGVNGQDPEVDGLLHYLQESGLQDDVNLDGDTVLENPSSSPGMSPPTFPDKVKAVPRLRADIGALRSFFEEEKPAMIVLRPVSGVKNFAYGFVDASGSGFGGTWRTAWDATHARHGFWCQEVGEESSNYREFRNLVEHVDAQVGTGELSGKEVWVFTDNAVTENAIFTGTSKSKKLFELVVRLRKLEIEGSFVLRVVHVAGTRMIGEGTDGLSRGEVNPAALLDPALGSVPLHLPSLERSVEVRRWLTGWLGTDFKVTSPKDWFGRAQQNQFDNPNSTSPETWVWDLPPAAAAHALEELALGRVKRHDIMRGVVIDTTVRFLVWHGKDPNTGEDVVDEEEAHFYLRAREGDHLICPFECDTCCFWRLTSRAPRKDDPGDSVLMAYIRRAILDSFWARAPSTVEANRRSFWEQVEWGEALGFPMFPPLGPFDKSYDPGLKAALGVLWKSNQPGRHETTQKFSSARKARGIHTNLHKASASGIRQTIYSRTDQRRGISGTAPVDSEFYTLFTRGLEYRIGQRVKRDMAVSVEIMLELQRIAEREWNQAGEEKDTAGARKVAEWACFFLFAFCHSLRGFEVVRATLHDLTQQVHEPRDQDDVGYIGLPLLGRFKHCGNAQQHMLCMIAGTTRSGLKPLMWTKRLLDTLETVGTVSDWLFQEEDGSRRKMNDFSERFYDNLREIQREQGDMIPVDIDVTEEYFLGRSFRRGATSRAQSAGVSESDINWVNRWGSGRELIVKGPMRVIYSERTQMQSVFLRFSKAL